MNSLLYGRSRLTYLDGLGVRIDQLNSPESVTPATSRLRTSQRATLAGSSTQLVGREAQLAKIRRAIGARRPIEFVSPCGFGKTSLLKHSATGPDARQSALPHIYIRVHDSHVGDLLQILVNELYEFTPRIKMSSMECVRILRRTDAVIALDDVRAASEALPYLPRAAPNCSFIVGASQSLLGTWGESCALPGLPEGVALNFLMRELGRSISGSELPAAQRLISAVRGQPLNIKQAASLVRSGDCSIEFLVHQVESDAAALDRLSVSALSELERRALAALTLAAGALLPAGLVSVIGEMAFLADVLTRLADRGLVDHPDDRFGIPVCKVESYRDLLIGYVGLASSLRAVGDWLASGDSTGKDARSAGEAIVSLIGTAAAYRQLGAVVRLVRLVEPILFVEGRWEAWQEVISRGFSAARSTGDRAAEALFAHEQGTLLWCNHREEEARGTLQHALRLREESGDGAGADLTAHNLALFTGGDFYGRDKARADGPLPPPPPPPSHTRRAWKKAMRRTGMGVFVSVSGLVIATAIGKAVEGQDDPPQRPPAPTRSADGSPPTTPPPTNPPTTSRTNSPTTPPQTNPPSTPPTNPPTTSPQTGHPPTPPANSPTTPPRTGHPPAPPTNPPTTPSPGPPTAPLPPPNGSMD